MTSNNSQANNYVDMHTVGLGYMTRVRNVQPKKGNSFLACAISGFHGEKGVKDGMTWVPFDVKAASEQAFEILKTFETQANDRNQKVLVRFKIGDQYLDSYTQTKGEKAGQTAFVLKGRLLFVSHVWVKASDADDSKYELAYEYVKPEEEGAQAPESEGKDGTNG